MIRVAVVDDHPVVRDGMIALLRDEPDFKVVADFSNAEDLLRALPEARPDVVVLDLELPGISGLSAIERLKREAPKVPVVVFTAYDIDDTVLSAMRGGAKAYVLKGAPSAEVVRAIRQVHGGGTYLQASVAAKISGLLRRGDARATLTRREQDVARLVADGLSNKQIGAALGISERTAKFHVSSVMSKLGAANRTQVAKFAAQWRRL
jgi:DNA-binding NarL/FixJ family response regulator